MDNRARIAFHLLIGAQALHSIEEYLFRLYDALAPARAVSEALGLDRRIGFAVANTALIGFGLWCYFALVRPGRPSARGFAWFWALLEIANAIGHGALALWAGGYFPGLATAPLLLAAGLWLGARLRRGP
ncbi:MAG TPA: HXXEE domain-containing protein [Allosphingosinicella sp.]|nr:HXXEE domain-containing protein [Allosphingosinicella sp.]